MAFKKGTPKPPGSGRKKGVTNKPKPLEKTLQVLTNKALNPVEEILKLIPAMPPRDQYLAWVELQSWIEAKPKAHTEPPSAPTVPVADPIPNTQTDEDLLRLVK